MVNFSKSQQNNKTGGGGFATRMRNLVTNRNKSVTSTKVINAKVDSTCDISVGSASDMSKGFRRRRKKAQENQSFELNDGLGTSHSDAAKGISEPSLAAQYTASNNRSRVDAFVREASSIASLTSSSVTASSKASKKGGR